MNTLEKVKARINHLEIVRPYQNTFSHADFLDLGDGYTLRIYGGWYSLKHSDKTLYSFSTVEGGELRTLIDTKDKNFKEQALNSL